MGLLGKELGVGGVSVLSKWCFCLTPSDSPPETVSAQVEMTVTVTSREFTKELEDRDSVEFKNFSDTFTQEVSLGKQVPVGNSGRSL